MDFLRDIFQGDDEVLFFILIFLFLFFKNNWFGKERETRETEENENGAILFFIVLFILLFINSDDRETTGTKH